ncbi:hypothetical protein HNQ94_002374 [Salirhabdus euzebyi]|uniref:DUF2529 domain-containing protein n=1 Tax=Salirhabdus euzebyi TaxID=394506 RepID=A0A841Q6E3_9BACI|nr:DUF2529 family protein [Salirhabdus euzebyi]MBB6453923.1 hypothetical protein [Salirhabdus euzebyi]
MLQMLATQLIGEFNKIKENEWQHIEDVSRTLSNTIIGDGNIYWYGNKEMKGLLAEIVEGAEPFPDSKAYDPNETDLSELDRLVIATRFSDDTEILPYIKKAQATGAEVIVLCAVKSTEDEIIQQANFYVDTKLTESLIPMDNGRIGFPSLLTMLFVYYGIYLTTQDILSDFEGPLPTMM